MARATVRTYRRERRERCTKIDREAPTHKQRAPRHQPWRVEPETCSQRIRAHCHSADGHAREPLATPLHIAKLRNDVHENRERNDRDPRESDQMYPGKPERPARYGLTDADRQQHDP
jgi:hypothetical protein